MSMDIYADNKPTGINLCNRNMKIVFGALGYEVTGSGEDTFNAEQLEADCIDFIKNSDKELLDCGFIETENKFGKITVVDSGLRKGYITEKVTLILDAIEGAEEVEIL